MPLRGSFGIEYKHPEHPDNICAVDWNHWERGRWVRSFKDSFGTVWYRDDEGGEELNQLAYEAILEKFGLYDFKGALPPETIQFMSPADLVRYRRDKRLPSIKICSDTSGDCEARAEEYE